ncbi:MAG: hypothetical protein KDA99_29855, partial [Planctomycetales bacterium]|nr:hypothetical protein [Planctomycetales bacterium]
VVRVFVLAGQSNMEGKAPNALFEHQANDPKTSDFFARFRKDGKWVAREDVFIKFLDRHGKLTLGYGSPERTGVELAFGTVLGDHFDDPVLLIKTAWGGHSLVKDFRPPSAGFPNDEYLAREFKQAQDRIRNDNEKNNRDQPLPTLDEIKSEYGESYRDMLKEVQQALQQLGTLFPELAGKQPVMTGFVWFQGWNDQYGGEGEYASNMEHFIRDIREDFHAPNLPVVIGVMGQNGSQPAEGAMLVVQKAQLAMQDIPDFAKNVRSVRTDLLIDKAAEELYPNWRDNFEEWQKVGGDFGYHYLGSAVWFCRIGDAMGSAMLELVEPSSNQ